MTTKPFNADAVHEIDTHLAHYAGLVANPTDLLIYVIEAVGTASEALIAPYPPTPNRPLSEYYTLDGKPSKFKTKRQRGFFFAALRDGKIKVPYTRSGDLGRGISHTIAVSGDMASYEISTTPNVSKYASLVIGDPGQQSHYHQQSGWRSMHADIEAGQAQMPQVIESAISRYVASQEQQP